MLAHHQTNQLHVVIAAVRAANDGQLDIAAYGSLPDRPEHGMAEPIPARLPGYRKDMCIRERTCRGTAARPGLVAGLLPDPARDSMAMIFHSKTPDLEALVRRLSLRELDGRGYAAQPVLAQVDGTPRLALAFVAALGHPDVVELAPGLAAATIANTEGACGTNRAYLEQILAFENRVYGETTPELREIAEHLDRGPKQAATGDSGRS